MNPSSHDPSPWWRHRMMWLVVGGPLFVVIAAIVTGVIAVVGADPGIAVVDVQQVRSAAPALQGRNHAATPVEAKP